MVVDTTGMLQAPLAGGTRQDAISSIGVAATGGSSAGSGVGQAGAQNPGSAQVALPANSADTDAVNVEQVVKTCIRTAPFWAALNT